MRTRSIAALLAAGAGLACCGAANGQVMISEIMANEFGTDVPGEWIEIYNFSGAPVDIGGWRLADEDGNSPSEPFPVGYTIQAGEAIVVIASGALEGPTNPLITEADFKASWGTLNAAGQPYRVYVQQQYITYANTPSPTNEVLRLIDGLGNIVDLANYENNTNNWPPTPNGASIVIGPSFVDDISNDFGCAWAAALPGVGGAVTSVEVSTLDSQGTLQIALSGENFGSPGFVETGGGVVLDCNGNGIPDDVELCSGFETDCNGNGVLDSCEPDCDNNGIPDECDYQNSGFTNDCNLNGVLDGCEIAANPGLDGNGNGRLDSCEAIAGRAIITEIMFDPNTSADEMEYVEILNVSGAPLNISGWYLRDIEGTEDITDAIPSGTVLAANGIAVLTRSVNGDPVQTRLDYIQAWGATTPQGQAINWIPLENWGARATFGTTVTEVLTLVSNTDTIVDVANYSNRTSNSEPLPGGWPGADNHGSYYLAGNKLNATDNDSGPNWRLSIEGLSGARRSNLFTPGSEPTWVNPASSGADIGTPGFIFAGAPQEPAGSVIITEIFATGGSVFPGADPNDPLAPAGVDEWVEIYNTTGSTIDLTGWYLADEDGRTTGFAAGSTLAAGEVAVVFGNDFPLDVPDAIGAFYDAWGCGYKVFTTSSWYTGDGTPFGLGRLSNGPNFVNEILRIVNASGTPVDVVNYDDDGFVWPVDGTGVAQDDNWSVYILPPTGNYNSVDNNDGLVWASSLTLFDGGRIATTTPVFNAIGNLFGSPGHLQGVQVPDLNDCPATCTVDLTGDGQVDSGDLSAFITAFIAQDVNIADLTNDGQVDSGDLSAFITAFLVGC